MTNHAVEASGNPQTESESLSTFLTVLLEIKGFPQYGLNYVASLSRWHAMTQMTVVDRRIQEALPLAGDDNMQ